MRYSMFAALAVCAMPALAQTSGATQVGIRGSLFTINGKPTYTPESGFPNANPNLIGTLLNVRAV